MHNCSNPGYKPPYQGSVQIAETNGSCVGSEERALTRVFGPKRDELTEDRRKLRNEELHNVYSSPSIITMIKSRRVV
jgi:hypothetical protein